MAKRSKPKRKRPTPPPRRRARRHPAERDFDVVVQVGKRLVSVVFRPTNSHYLFRITADANARPRARANASAVEFHAATPGDASGYAESDIRDMSRRLAAAAVKDVLP